MSKSFEFYVIRQDLVVNPILGNIEFLRTQAKNDYGLCKIKFPVYKDTDSFLDFVKDSVNGNDCNIKVCRSLGCYVRFKPQADSDKTVTLKCDRENNCDEFPNIVEFR